MERLKVPVIRTAQELTKKPQITSPVNGCLLFALNLHFCRLPQPECISAYAKHEIKNKEAKNNYNERWIICENTNYCYMVSLYVLTPSGALSLILLCIAAVFQMLEDNIFRVPHGESSMHVEAKTF